MYQTTSDNEDDVAIPKDKPLIDEIPLDEFADERDKVKLRHIYEKYRVTMGNVEKQMTD